MLTVIRDAQGQIEAVMDYYLVNDLGELVFDGSGTHVWCERLEVSEMADGVAAFRRIVQQVLTSIPQAVEAYWVRKEKSGSTVFRFPRERFVKEVAKGEEVRCCHVEA